MSNSGGDLDNAIEISGASDGTKIGNVADAMKVSLSGTGATSEIEPATFIACAENTTIGNNKSMFSLLNASGSSVVVKIRALWLINSRSTAITGVVSLFFLRRMTGHSSGTSITPMAHDSGDSLSASVTAQTNGTISGEASENLRQFKWSSDEWGVGGVDVESYDHTIQQIFPALYAVQKTKPITLRAGEGITLKHVVNSTAGTFDVCCLFTTE